jgi:hypothetical protein
MEDGRPARHAQTLGQTGGTPVLHKQTPVALLTHARVSSAY